MRDEDRADKLARAIEEMVQGRVPENLDDEELEELLQIARIRLDAARLAAQAGAEAQSAVLERIIARLHLLRIGNNGEPNGIATVNDSAGDSTGDDGDPRQIDMRELQDIIGLRHQMAEHAAAVSERHREAVWQRVQARIQAERSVRRGLFRWPFRRRHREADEFAAAMDRIVLGEPIWEAEDSNLEELLRVARLRQAATVAEQGDFADQRARVWARLRPRLMARLMLRRRPRVFQRREPTPWRKLAAAGAVIALVIAALGPIPATGLAHHPVAEFARFVRSHIGVTETTAPPALPPVTDVVKSSDATVEEASALLGLPVHEPTFLPSGYQEVSSKYFAEPLTAEQGGLFVLAYDNSGLTDRPQSILIYQEKASSNSIAVQRGSAQDFWLLSADAPTTYVYVRGTWRPVGGELTWGNEEAQTVVFDVRGLRTIIHTSNGNLPFTELMAIAESLASQSVSPTN